MWNFGVPVVGELNLDLIVCGLPEQLDPELELLADRLVLTPGSSLAIFAHKLGVLWFSFASAPVPCWRRSRKPLTSAGCGRWRSWAVSSN
jgi:hypothetical protein